MLEVLPFLLELEFVISPGLVVAVLGSGNPAVRRYNPWSIESLKRSVRIAPRILLELLAVIYVSPGTGTIVRSTGCGSGNFPCFIEGI